MIFPIVEYILYTTLRDLKNDAFPWISLCQVDGSSPRSPISEAEKKGSCQQSFCCEIFEDFGSELKHFGANNWQFSVVETQHLQGILLAKLERYWAILPAAQEPHPSPSRCRAALMDF